MTKVRGTQVGGQQEGTREAFLRQAQDKLAQPDKMQEAIWLASNKNE